MLIFLINKSNLSLLRILNLDIKKISNRNYGIGCDQKFTKLVGLKQSLN